MKECYIEQLIKQKAILPTVIMKMMSIGLIVIIVLFWAMTELPLLFALIIIVLAVMMYKRTNLEYEYQYYNGDLDIDQIAGRQKRKRMFSIKLREIDIMARTDTAILDGYKGLKVFDCSSNQGNITYTIILEHLGEKVRVVIEPNEEILANIKYYEPRKVIIK